MAKASHDYEEDEYNEFLSLLEDSKVRGYVLKLFEGKEICLPNEYLELLEGLTIVAEENGRTILTGRGISLAKALVSLQLLESGT